MQDRPRSTSRTGFIVLLICVAALALFAGGYQFGKSLAKADNARPATLVIPAR
ncbi:hypothetical protein [Stenotrophomonas tuberculopleuritidis]|uniref:hypothetical protein n=1 Tax=Stenotrophomonas tuberculopleuritidis TaxID=3055079 RepID=UPI0026E5235C|nr:hypothetical protein [Stenotrophomonas sp. 704A1]